MHKAKCWNWCLSSARVKFFLYFSKSGSFQCLFCFAINSNFLTFLNRLKTVLTSDALLWCALDECGYYVSLYFRFSTLLNVIPESIKVLNFPPGKTSSNQGSSSLQFGYILGRLSCNLHIEKIYFYLASI